MKQLLAFAACAQIFAGGLAYAQDADFEMTPPDAAGGTEQVLGGTPVDVNVWPATLVFRSPGGLCTSTAVGVRAIITAAHCINDGAQGRIRIGNSTVRATCQHHPDYVSDPQMDVALCLTDADIQLVRGSKKYESLNQNPGIPRRNDALTLLGYGCTAVQGDNPSSILYGGSAPVKQFQQNYIVTVGSNAVCFGDSGGGAYAGSVNRKLVGINSRGDIISRSLLTNVASPQIAEFIQSWSTANNAAICGVMPNAVNCRS